ncbi:MAG TPA: HEAT repeat domain-containing protein [Candidatus Eisenbacteria bacterium]|nr:HEAT repeat domain-containing protein [Candidatus Eisenbacteria bacterium]
MPIRSEPRAPWALVGLCVLLAGVAHAKTPAVSPRSIAIAEDERRFRPEIEQGLKDKDPKLRVRAALAAGRLQDSTAVPALEPLLADAKPEVRREAVFALGQIGHRSARGMLEARLADQDPAVVVLATEALGKLGDKAATAKILPSLASKSAELRATTAMALWRLADSTALAPLLAHHQDADPEVRWRVLYALEKIVAGGRVIEVASQHLEGDASPRVRAYAARTLGRQKSPRAHAALVQALRQPDLAVVVNSVRALQFIGDTTCTSCGPALVPLLRHPHPYVRSTAAAALGERFAWLAADSLAQQAMVDSLGAHLSDPDAATRTAAARALIAMRPDVMPTPIRKMMLDDPSIYVRTGVMSALRNVTTTQTWLGFCKQHMDAKRPLFERMTAAEVLGARGEPGSADLLRVALSDTTTLFVAACASALAELKDTGSVPRLAAVYAQRAADADPDARIAIRDALRDLAGRAYADSIERAHPTQSSRPPSYPGDFEKPPKARGAILRTDQGDIEWAFYGHEAPQTVRNFVRLAKRGYFDGRAFHRVVPNFVIQDGDPTGTGSGGPGYTIRCEYNQLRYAPGMVGMALSGKDTGGSQWFITHSPQPHLDGRYTIFARVVKGMDAVQKIVQGDHVFKVEILE